MGRPAVSVVPGDLSVTVAGEAVTLIPERAIYWPRVQALIVADLHWGKAATFRAAGVALPPGTTTDDLARLSGALRRTGARQLILLGDLFHARPGREADHTLGAIAAWHARHPALDILLVRGNHDRRAGDPPAELGIEVVDAPHRSGPFVLRHEPAEDPEAYALAGHLHPACIVTGAGRQHARLPCFLLGLRGAVLPAFGSFTGTSVVEPRATDRVFVVAGNAVIAVPA